jgi:hypothetical protein
MKYNKYVVASSRQKVVLRHHKQNATHSWIWTYSLGRLEQRKTDVSFEISNVGRRLYIKFIETMASELAVFKLSLARAQMGQEWQMFIYFSF